MNVLKGKTQIMLLACLLLLVQGIVGQNNRSSHPRHHGLSEKLQEELNLTSEQEAQIDAINAEYKEKRKVLRANNTSDKQQQRVESKKLSQEQRTAIENVLTEEQLEVLNDKREKRVERRKEAWSKVDKEGLKAELEAYRVANIQPVMTVQRAKLEPSISAEDKATLNQLRVVFEEKKAERKEAREMHQATGKKTSKEAHQARKAAAKQDENRQKLKVLVEKYEPQIDKLLAEIEPQKAKWKADQKAIMEKYKPTDNRVNTRNGLKQKGKKRMKRMGMNKGNFLLLSPN